MLNHFAFVILITITSVFSVMVLLPRLLWHDSKQRPRRKLHLFKILHHTKRDLNFLNACSIMWKTIRSSLEVSIILLLPFKSIIDCKHDSLKERKTLINFFENNMHQSKITKSKYEIVLLTLTFFMRPIPLSCHKCLCFCEVMH